MTTPTVTWFEIGSADVPATQRFFGDLFGWTFSAEDYSEVRAEGRPIGGVRSAGTGYAVFYVQVSDVDAARRRVVELGGQALTEVLDGGDGLRLAHVTDPGGSRFGLFSESAAG